MNKTRAQGDWGPPLLCPSWDYCQVTVLVSCSFWSPSTHALPWHTHANAHIRQGWKLQRENSPQRHRAQVPRICWDQNELELGPLWGEHPTAEPGSCSCSLSISQDIPCQEMSHGGSTLSTAITGIWHLSRTHQNKDFITWVSVFPAQNLVGT